MMGKGISGGKEGEDRLVIGFDLISEDDLSPKTDSFLDLILTS
jgi:hypothetical protein